MWSLKLQVRQMALMKLQLELRLLISDSHNFGAYSKWAVWNLCLLCAQVENQWAQNIFNKFLMNNEHSNRLWFLRRLKCVVAGSQDYGSMNLHDSDWDVSQENTMVWDQKYLCLIPSSFNLEMPHSGILSQKDNKEARSQREQSYELWDMMQIWELWWLQMFNANGYVILQTF